MNEEPFFPNMKADADELLKLDNQLCFPLYACSKEVVHRYAPLLEPLNLTYTQYICMMVLWEEGETSVHALGERLFLDSGTLTPLLKKLEAKGYVERIRSETDARVLMVRLTFTGHALKQHARYVPVQMGACIGLSLEEAAELDRLLHKVLDSIHDQ